MDQTEVTAVEQVDSVTVSVSGCIPLPLLQKEIDAQREPLSASGVSEPEIREFAVSILIMGEVQKALEGQEWQGVSAPEITLNPREEDGYIDFKANVSIYPRPDIVDYEEFWIDLEPFVITDERIDAALQDLAVAHARRTGMKDWVINDEFAEEVAPGCGSLDVLLQRLREEEEERAAQLELGAIRDAVFEEILDRNPFIVPQSLIDDEIRGFLIADGRLEHQKDDIDFNIIPVDSYRAEYQERAEKRTRLTILIDRLSEIEDIHPGEEDLEQAISEIAELHGSPYEAAYEYLEENGFILEVVLAVTQEKVFQFLLDRTTVSYKEPQ